MAFNRKKFLSALLDISEGPPPPSIGSPMAPTFAKFMASKTYGAADTTDIALVSAKEEQEREEGALAKTFGFLMAPMSTVQNTIMDVTDDSQSGLEKIGNVATDVAAGAAHLMQPTAELLAIPGVKVPWEPEKLSKFVEEENTEYHGTGPMYGSRLLKERFGVDPKNDIHGAMYGLFADIATDPLTYTGGIGLLSKAGKAKDVLDMVAAGSKEAKPLVTGSAEALTKPSVPEIKQPPWYQSVKPDTSVGNIKGITPPPLNALKIGLKLKDEFDPASLRSMQAASAADTRWYEKLHPVEIPNVTVPKNPKFASYEEVGSNVVESFDEFAEGAARDLTRDEQVQLLGDVLDVINTEGIALSTKSVAEQKYIIKGVEDLLEQRGFTFHEGKLSQYLHSTKDSSIDNLRVFSEGKPLKERPMDASMEAKLLEARKAQGRALLEAKLAKKSPGAVVTNQGINSRVVAEAIDRVASGTNDVVYRIPEARGADVIKHAVDAAESYKGLMGTTAGGVRRHANLTPANQANLYNRMWNATEKIMRENPETLSRFRNKGGELVHDSKQARNWRRATSLSMLKTAEAYLERTHGLRGQHWDGSGLKLSAVIEELGPNALEEHLTKVLDAFRLSDPSKVSDPIAKAAIVQAIARRKLETGAVAKIILDDFVDKAKIMEGTVSRQKYLEWKNGEAAKKAKSAAQMAGLTKEEAARVLDLVKNHINTEQLEMLEPMQILDSLGPATIQAVKEGRADHTLITKINKALQQAVDETPKQQRLDIAARTALDTTLMRFTTWYGRGDMIHSARESYSYLEEWAKARGDWFNNIAKNYTPDEQLTAFKHAQGHFMNVELAMAEKGVSQPIVNERVAALSAKITDYFENIVASTRTINDPNKLKGSVAVRANVMMDDINKQLRAVGSGFQFTSKVRKGGKNIAGNPADYSEGNWLASWENVDPTKIGQDPAHFMYDLSLAVDRVTTEYGIIDDFVMRFGRPATEFPQGVPNPHHRINTDMRFDPDVNKQFTKLLQDLEKGSWMPTNAFTRQYVKYLRLWKTGVTQYNPSFHLRNAIGDAFLMWAAGHNNPVYFQKSAKMIAANRARYKEAIQDPDLMHLQGLMSKEDYGIMQSKDTTTILEKYGAKLTSAEIYGEAMMRGQLLDANRATDIIGEPLFANVAGRNPGAVRRFLQKPLGGHAHNTVMKTTEVREHLIRLAHFTAVVDKGITKAMAKRLRAIDMDDSIANKVAAKREVLKSVYDKASQEVRKWHPDGRDLSYFEQKYMRQIIPFYSWQRKILPLLAEAALMRPSKMTAYPKGMFALQQAMGIEAPAIQDPFPQDQLFPDWMRAYGIGPIGDPQSDNAAAAWWGKLGRNALLPGVEGESGYTVVNPGNPFNDTVSQYGGIGSGPLESLQKSSSLLTPAFNIPKELLTGTAWTGAPIGKDEGGAGYGKWASTQVPIISMLNRPLNIGAKEQENVEPGTDNEALLNILTALGIKGSGQYLKSAEFDAKAAARKAAGG